MLQPSGASTDPTAYKDLAIQYCDDFTKTHPNKAEWFLWDRPQANKAAFRSAYGACFTCQNPSSIKKTVHFPSISMRDILRNIPLVISMFDIDAQGADVAILKSIPGSLLKRVETLRLECQDLPNFLPLYKSEIPNSCADAITYLQNIGFELVKQEVNNCACAEYNLIMENKNPVVVVE